MSEQNPKGRGRAYKETARNRRCRQAGTLLANYTSSPSCERLGGWGGPRNRADRTSDGLADKQVRAILDAAGFAIKTGRTFQRHWTIHYGKAGVKGENGAKFVSEVLAMASKQARREGGALTALWVRECASDKGEHVHILMHLPADMRLHGRTRRWIEAAGGAYRPGVSKVRLIGGRLSKVVGNRDAQQVLNAAKVARYLVKAADVETGEKLKLKYKGRGGRIVGKRCGWTQNIGASARSRFLYRTADCATSA